MLNQPDHDWLSPRQFGVVCVVNHGFHTIDQIKISESAHAEQRLIVMRLCGLRRPHGFARLRSRHAQRAMRRFGVAGLVCGWHQPVCNFSTIKFFSTVLPK